jgi:amidase
MLQSAASLARSLRNGEVTSEDVVTVHLANIEKLNSQINAVVTLADDVIDQARRADADLAQGKSRGPLHGLPMTIKDCFDTAGLVSTWGTLGRASFVPGQDATVVSRLKAAGAILLGKTNTPEFTLNFSTYNKMHGFTRNPYDLTRSPGGSSGGAAAAIATGMTAFDIGTDFGGSVRVPSHFCGTVGIKPTSGSISRTGFCVPPGWLMDFMSHVGPMARRVEDLRLILPVIWGPDAIDTTIVPVPLANPDQVIPKGLRCAVMIDNGITPPDEETIGAVRSAAAALQDAGLAVCDDQLQGINQMRDVVSGLYQVGGYAHILSAIDAAGTGQADIANNWLIPPDPNEISEKDYAQWQDAYFSPTAEQINNQLTLVESFRRQMLAQMNNYDVLLSPVNPAAAPKLPAPGESPFPDGSYTELFDVTGWPAGVVRAGTSSDGLPIGVQVVANPWREDIVLAVMALIEDALPEFPPPDLARLSTS